MDERTLAQRYFVARVLHSGPRALQLRRKPNDSLSMKEIKELNAIHKLVQSWFVEADKHPDEQFIFRKCQRAISQISHGPKSASLWHKPACGSCELRDNQNSLWNPLTAKIIDAFEDQLAKLRADDEPPFWALFDILWAAEVGYIQWFADRHSGKAVSGYESEVNSLTGKIRNPMPEPCALRVLLYGWSQDLKTPDPLLPGIGHSLVCFHSFLRDRQAKLADSDLAITKLSGELQDKIESWIRQGCGYRDLNLRSPDKPPLDTAYVLSCPQMHVVPEFELRTFIENTRSDLTDIFNDPKLLDIEILQMPCPLCSPTSVVKHARMIEPLNYLSERLRRLAEASKASRAALAPQAPQTSEISSSSAVAVAGGLGLDEGVKGRTDSSEHSTEFLADDRSTTSGTVASVKGKSPSFTGVFSVPIARYLSETHRKPDRVIEVKPKCRFDKYCFSADGRVLILWKSKEEHIFASTVPTIDGPEPDTMWNWNTFFVPGLILGAGGGHRIAGISKIGRKQRLLVFSAPQPVAILDITLPRVGQVRSIAVSPDGNYVAVGSDGQLSIYAVNDGHAQPKQIMLSNHTSQVDSQKENFSQDGNIVAIVTRRINGQIELALLDHLKGSEIWQRKPIDYGQTTDNDHGLSAVFYDSQKSRVVLFAYINKPYSIVHSRTREYVGWKTQNGKIQTAVQCPSGSQYILLTATGRLYQLDLETLAPVLMDPKWNFKHQPQSPDEFVALAMPADDIIYVFRMENNEMMLEVVRGKSMPVKIRFLAPPTPDI